MDSAGFFAGFLDAHSSLWFRRKITIGHISLEITMWIPVFSVADGLGIYEGQRLHKGTSAKHRHRCRTLAGSQSGLMASI